mmetsp:Transcript_13354/g.20245  ORF Transcript_13354/g.20245 Transcript_13354/m.20245 type:complete len:321 (-) Transcript_13354:190-1152(-)|eukprot:CAMPEP_0118706766 /NCGR_PEP_ID=MMETSP0800-20121206/20766_1 /TAXON_ID=210618 ORGANISM="Striatella unipunctata, Strain CCMP2910" /NCGR_SAMPLE_ID=MMETSP0800 /ASSEMBLY_ACC=CAM_ASM_000638 /LENGTH=320 /DNA_ID=CAMNT_0006609389 /DNA_START=154 /DNA_END=1116 /DNA_ORIENTATION=-
MGESKQAETPSTTDNPQRNGELKKKEPIKTPYSSIVGFSITILITIFTCPKELHTLNGTTVLHVWYYGWLTAISTGLGVIPLILVPQLDSFWIGCANAFAAGMMIAASYSLFVEGISIDEPSDISHISCQWRTALGAILGLVFILASKKFLDRHEDLKFGDLGGADARKLILIFCVMTLHSFSEGVGVGVSFGGEKGRELGMFISASLAIHNIPEGLAVAIVLLPKRISKLSVALWCIATSIPQPLMAVPAYLFVHSFIPVLSVGLGFAGGAMAWVAFFELLVEACEETDLMTTGMVSVLSFTIMSYVQSMIDMGARQEQ